MLDSYQMAGKKDMVCSATLTGGLTEGTGKRTKRWVWALFNILI
jgi:hypothetical protein